MWNLHRIYQNEKKVISKMNILIKLIFEVNFSKTLILKLYFYGNIFVGYPIHVVMKSKVTMPSLWFSTFVGSYNQTHAIKTDTQKIFEETSFAV